MNLTASRTNPRTRKIEKRKLAGSPKDPTVRQCSALLIFVPAEHQVWFWGAGAGARFKTRQRGSLLKAKREYTYWRENHVGNRPYTGGHSPAAPEHAVDLVHIGHHSPRDRPFRVALKSRAVTSPFWGNGNGLCLLKKYQMGEMEKMEKIKEGANEEGVEQTLPLTPVTAFLDSFI